MIRLLFITVFVAAFSAAFGQQFPIFKDRKDSIQFEKIVKTLWFRPADDTVRLTRKQYDSLNSALTKLRDKAIGWGQLYKPNRHFVAYADLKSGNVNPDTVIRLSISNVTSREVPKEVLACKNLEELELVNTRIDVIQEELNVLPKLISLYLYHNIPSSRLILEKNDHISYVRIAGHNPEKLPKNYKNFASLDSLNINRSMSARLPNIKKNKELIIINAVGNNIRLKGYKKSVTLQHLDLRLNKITQVPNSIARKYPKLKALSFNANPVKKVKPGLGKLKDLEYLSFYGNMLPAIPAPVYKLTKLRVVDLFDNRIEFIGPEIKNLQQLRILYLANNRLYSLPDEIGLLQNLEEVYVYNNRMDTLPASMDKLQKLRILWVNDNFFHTIPATTWRAGNVDYLDASQNFIKRVPNEVADAKLSTLILSGTLLHKEHENPELFRKLREQGTRIIYYTADSDVSLDDEF